MACPRWLNTQAMLYRQRYQPLNKQEEGNTEERLLSHVSHRVRTPLNSVIGFSKLIMSGDIPQGRTQEFAERIMDSGYQVLQYFQNLIDLSELESGMIKVNPSHTSLDKLLKEVTGSYKDRLGNDNSIDLYLMDNENVDELTVFTDEYILERVTNNVIELSRSFIDEGLVTIEYQMMHKQTVLLEIRGIRSSQVNGSASYSSESEGYDYFTWKAIQQLIGLIHGKVTCRTEDREVIYRVVFPCELSIR